MFSAQIKKEKSAVLKQLIIPLHNFQESSHLSFSGIDGSLTWSELLNSCCVRKNISSLQNVSIFRYQGSVGKSALGVFWILLI